MGESARERPFGMLVINLVEKISPTGPESGEAAIRLGTCHLAERRSREVPYSRASLAAICSRSAFLDTLPMPVSGNDATSSRRSGSLNLAMFFASRK